MSSVEDKISELVSSFTLEEILEMNDLLPEEAILILFERGFIQFPGHMSRDIIETYNDDPD